MAGAPKIRRITPTTINATPIMATETSKIGSATIDNQTKYTYMYDANFNHYITEIEHKLEDNINILGISMDNDSLKHFVQQAKVLLKKPNPAIIDVTVKERCT